MSESHGHRTTLGQRGEDLACHVLEEAGLEVVARNWRLTSGPLRGELDIVALDHADAQVVVCEVKTRGGRGFGGPLLAITPRKQAKIRALAIALLRSRDLPYRRVRFDVVAIVWSDPPTVRHLRGAF